MKLITEEIKKRFNEIGDQSEVEDPIVIVKFFNPSGAGTWYATEYDPETEICKGFVTGFTYDEWGYFSIPELESVKGHLGLPMERDLYFQEENISAFITHKRIYELKEVSKEVSKEEDKDQDIER